MAISDVEKSSTVDTALHEEALRRRNWRCSLVVH